MWIAAPRVPNKNVGNSLVAGLQNGDAHQAYSLKCPIGKSDPHTETKERLM